MKMIKNIGNLDRIIRVFFAEILGIIAFFWLAGAPQIVVASIALILLVTAGMRFCILYTFGGLSTCKVEEKVLSKISSISLGLVFSIILILGSLGSVFFTKKFFLEDYSRMNQYYKQTLFYTGQNKRDESVANYMSLVNEYEIFYQKYSQYQPYSLTSDKKFASDILSVKNRIVSLGDTVKVGDLPAAHKEFELIRPVFQDILKRNNFSMFSVYLVDFHDAMEKIITAADEKSSAEVIRVYVEVDEKMKALEELDSSEEVQDIRNKLEDLYTAAKNNDNETLSGKASLLKSSFVKVYLKRG